MLPLRILRLAFASLASTFLLLGVAGASTEPFFPHAGNAGYDALAYQVRLSFRPAGGTISAVTTMQATATTGLSRFSLDFAGPRVDAVLVDGEPARFDRMRGKLVVRPAQPIARGQSFETLVRYHGRPHKITDPDGSQEGWYRTDDGALAVGEPQGTAAWIPCNNVPADKASFRFDLTVPAPLQAVANGRLVKRRSEGEQTTFSWVEAAPMSTYLALADFGRGKLVKSKIAGLPAWTLVDPRLARGSRRPLAALAKIIRFESSIYGPYPFDSAGSVVDLAPKLGYALETQSRPIYAFAPDRTTVVHETAHQWFGDSVGLERWPNIWLNEGFATWTEWYYAERHGGRSVHAIFNRLHRVPASNHKFWEPPSAHPGSAKNLFGTSTYVRGGMALEALRLKIGTKPMLRLLRTWATQHRYGSADIKEFIALAEKISGRQLDRLFHRWLYQRGKP
jgi:aminopeptidase N